MNIEPDDFARAFMAFMTAMHERSAVGETQASALVGVLGEFLGGDPTQLEPIRSMYPEHRAADVDIALERLGSEGR